MLIYIFKNSTNYYKLKNIKLKILKEAPFFRELNEYFEELIATQDAYRDVCLQQNPKKTIV